jgi:hypothetical protein
MILKGKKNPLKQQAFLKAVRYQIGTNKQYINNRSTNVSERTKKSTKRVLVSHEKAMSPIQLNRMMGSFDHFSFGWLTLHK